MDFEVLANLSWREALIAIVALLALYVVVVFFRLRRLGQGKVNVSVPEQLAAKSAISAYAAVQESPAALVAPSEFAFPWNEPPAEIPGQQRVEALERELAQLREEVRDLRADVLNLREKQRCDLAQSQAVQNVSPLYSDAMQMVIQGHDAASISQHCGISRAEAELVVALVRNRND
ncbi:DUF2802 domain-containing protein [Propionivibrio sp.]|uniref:DUF2802 domain-containing protein n=1 Tax=Propionivibrio sp. TaxID=2212460 RepID=UPI00261EDD98|nr:DUF2802 domain-containing protein [Propionivibrio sp.]